MTHDDRAYAVEAMIGVHLQTASHPEVVKLLAAEFAAVEDATIGRCINDAQELERVLQGRIAALESEVSRLRAGLASIVALTEREPFDGAPTYAPAGFQALCILDGSTRHLERVQEQSTDASALRAFGERVALEGLADGCNDPNGFQQANDASKREWARTIVDRVMEGEWT